MRVLKDAVLARLLAYFEGGQATMAVEVWVQAGGFDVERRQACVDAAGQRWVGRLAGERLDADLQRNTLRHVGDWEYMLRRRLGELPHQLIISSTDPVRQRDRGQACY